MFVGVIVREGYYLRLRYHCCHRRRHRRRRRHCWWCLQLTTLSGFLKLDYAGAVNFATAIKIKSFSVINVVVVVFCHRRHHRRHHRRRRRHRLKDLLIGVESTKQTFDLW